MPARQGRAVIGDIARSPKDALFIKVPVHLVVGAKDVEIAARNRGKQEVHRLLRGPGPCRLFRPAMRRQGRVDISRNEQPRLDPAIGNVAQMVLQGFGEHLHPRLREVVDRIAGGCGDALFGPGVDDQPGRTAGNHPGCKDLRPADDAHHVDGDDAVPVGFGIKDAAAGLHACVVDQHMNNTEGGIAAVGQHTQGGGIADIGFADHHIGTIHPQGQHLRPRSGQPVGAQISQTDPQAKLCQMLGNCQTNARGRAGNHRDIAFFQSRNHHLTSRFALRRRQAACQLVKRGNGFCSARCRAMRSTRISGEYC